MIRTERISMNLSVRNTFARIWIAALVSLLLGLTAIDSLAAGQEPKWVFILNSFNRGYTWTDNMLRGIDDAFDNSGIKVETYITFMDMKRIPPTPQYFSKLKELIKEGYKGVRFNAVLACDNDALEFMRKYRDELFPGVPVVFSSINDFDERMLEGRRDLTGTSENTDYTGAIRIALKLRPVTKNIVVVTDNTTTGKAHRSAVEKIRPDFPQSLGFTYISLADLTLDELAQKLSQLNKDSIVLLLQHFVDRNGTTYTVQQSTPLLTKSSSVPVFVLTDIRMGLGALGGHLVRGYHHGEAAAQMVVKILRGTDVKAIPVLLDSPNRYMFDYGVMQRFKISESDLPQGSILINKPVSVLETYKKELLSVLVVFIALCGILVYSLFEIRRRRRIETALRVREEKIEKLANEQRLILNCMPIGVSFLKDRSVLYRNAAFDFILGYEIGTTKGMNTSAFYADSETYERIGKEGYAAIANGGIYTVETVMKKKDGSQFFCSIVGQAVNAGKPEDGAIWMIQDITDRKRMEEAYKDSEFKYRSLIEHSSDVVFCVDRNGEYKFVNQVFASTFGKTPDYFLGKTFWDIYSKEHADYRQAASSRVFATGESQSVEVVVPLPDRTLYFIAKANPVRDETGKVVLNLTHATDITERKKAEEVLRDAHWRLESIIEGTHVGTWERNVQTGETVFSEVWAQIIGYTLDELA
ncbi:MAG: PAS domain S-box protein, partial [Pseudomonadota bacterium]